MKRLLTVTLLLWASVAAAQNFRVDNVALGPKGPIPGASVAFCTQPANTSTTPCSPLAAACSSLTDLVCNQPNPVTADGLGNYHAYLKTANSPLTIQIYGPQVASPLVLPDQGTSGTSGTAGNPAAPSGSVQGNNGGVFGSIPNSSFNFGTGATTFNGLTSTSGSIISGINATTSGTIGLANGNVGGTTWKLGNSRYTTAFTQDTADYSYDVRAFGATLSGTGTSGGGTDDTAAIANCLTIFRSCTIAAIVAGGTTHIRLSSSQALGGTEGNRTLICSGGNNNGFNANSGTVSLDVDNGGGIGPSFIYGTPSGQPFNGFNMIGCHVRDISANHNSPGFMALQNISNSKFIGTGGDSFQLQPLGAPTNPGTLAACVNDAVNGHIDSTAGNLSEQLQWIGPGGGASLPSTITTGVTISSLGCNTTTCKCLPTTMNSQPSTVQAIEVFWCQGGGCTPKQMGLPFACSAGTCNFANNFVFGGTNTPAGQITSIPTTGQGVDLFDHTGGYVFYTVGTSGQNCGNHLDSCNGTGNANQNLFAFNDFAGNNVNVDVDAGSPATMVSGIHSDFRGTSAWTTPINLGGTVQPTAGIQSEGGLILSGPCHFEGNPANSAPHLSLTGFNTLINNCNLEAGTATSVGLKGTSLKSAIVTNVTCGFLIGTCITDDSNSSNNFFLVSPTSGTITTQATDTVIQPNGGIKLGTSLTIRGTHGAQPGGVLQQTANSDTAGVITCVASTFTKTFTAAYNSKPVVITNDETSAGGVKAVPSTTNIVFTCPGATDVVDYWVVGNPN